ncbi:MAG: sugar phosphate nucleotidyltransferase, partial [Nitrospirales bacterium]|nr:sugar phosphate nucleotidyltransferase [Nitrospirales bacterium]
DSYLEMDYPSFFSWYEMNGTPVAMVVRQVPDVRRYGSVVLENNRVVAFQEKGRQGVGLVNAGVYVIRPTLFSDGRFGKAFSFEKDVLQRHGRELCLRAYVSNGYFIDIGTPEDYDRAQREFVRKERKKDGVSMVEGED